MKRAWAVLPAALAAAAAGAVVAVAVRGSTSTATAAATGAAAPAPVAVATVARTNLTATVLTGGTLGYAPTRPVINRVAGTYTWLPAAGSQVTAGHPLYRVDDLPVVLMTGSTPAWRPFAFGMTGGPDVRQLQANLIAEGYAAGLLTAPDGNFGPGTEDAVVRWQTANGYPLTGEIGLGQVVFLPSAVRVGALAAAAGQGASPGQSPYQVTASQRTVAVPLNPSLPSVQIGEPVSIVLPTNATTPGTVTAIDAAPAAGSGGSATSAQATVTPGRPDDIAAGTGVPVQVSLAVQSARNVLAVPVSALLALSGGGYGLEVIAPGGAHHLAGVVTGTFAGGLVQVSGPGITPGTRVVTAP